MSSAPSGILPADGLKAAIACLDLSLEAELALFRRAQDEAREALLALPAPDPEPDVTKENDIEISVPEPSDLAEAPSTPDVQIPDPSEVESEIEPAPMAANLVPLAEPEEDLETLPEPYSAELTAQPEAFEQFLDPSIEDYLESSEALLKHLDEPVKEAIIFSAPEPPKKNWAIAAGIGLIGLGMLILAGFFTVLATRWLAPKDPNPTPVPQSSIPQTNAPLSPTALSASGTLGQGGGTEPAGENAPSGSAVPSPSAANYIVLTEYRGLESLEAARAIVPDAFIADIDGKQHIQMGFLETAQQAQQVVDELKRQGFSATIQGLN